MTTLRELAEEAEARYSINQRPLTDKWKATALLEGLDETKQEECAALLEGLLRECIQFKEPHTLPPVFTNCLFPVARRLMGEGLTLQVEPLFTEFLEFTKTAENQRGEISPHIDYEVELCIQFVEKFISKQS